MLNEANYIGRLLSFLEKERNSGNIKEILVVDGGSQDQSIGIVKACNITLLTSKKGRAVQMNLGAKNASGDILYFLHADTLPPKDFAKSIINVVKKGTLAGCFQMQFDSNSRFLKFFAWFSRINHKICRGGDQSLFVTRDLFHKTKGFNEDYKIYEDNEYIGRLYRYTKFTVLPQKVRTSARKFERMGAFRLQYYFGMIHLQNYLGAGPEQLYEYYKRKITS